MATELAYALPMKSGKAGFEGPQEAQHHIGLPSLAKSVKNLEKGTNTWDRFEMLGCTSGVTRLVGQLPDVVKQITDHHRARVEVEATITHQ
ncbi:hypothetical protein ZWY2020_030042 [Hordeum vulgare]|nr:hypothetical protein ZWY2020_030042 [Hordeum vulgare]